MSEQTLLDIFLGAATILSVSCFKMVVIINKQIKEAK